MIDIDNDGNKHRNKVCLQLEVVKSQNANSFQIYREVQCIPNQNQEEHIHSFDRNRPFLLKCYMKLQKKIEQSKLC